MAKVSKVVFGNDVVIDLTGDTIALDGSDLALGKTAHGADGEIITGTNTFDSDTSDATVVAGEILSGKTAYARGSEVVGTMPNRGGVTGTITTKSQEYSIQSGYHDGSGKVSIDSTEQSKIIESNIKAGVVILGVEGNYTGEAISAQTKNATPYTTAQTVLPDAGYDYLAQVNIAAISYTETPNSAGGLTASIGDIDPNA